MLFFVTILMHLAAALMHALIYRDGVFASMTGRSHQRVATHACSLVFQPRWSGGSALE
jgi:cytochrome b561